MKLSAPKLFVIFLAVISFSPPDALSQDVRTSRGNTNPARPSLVRASICEGIRENNAQNPGIVFSVSIGRVLCFSDFEAIPKKTFVYHNWYFRDRLVTRLKLALQPPRWAGTTSIQLREADKGAWRVEVADQDGVIFGTLRFSITD